MLPRLPRAADAKLANHGDSLLKRINEFLEKNGVMLEGEFPWGDQGPKVGEGGGAFSFRCISLHAVYCCCTLYQIVVPGYVCNFNQFFSLLGTVFPQIAFIYGVIFIVFNVPSICENVMCRNL